MQWQKTAENYINMHLYVRLWKLRCERNSAYLPSETAGEIRGLSVHL